VTGEGMHFVDIEVIETSRTRGSTDALHAADAPTIPNAVRIDGRTVGISAEDPFIVERVETHARGLVRVTCTFIARSIYFGPERPSDLIESEIFDE
jgi:hypothetical protein